MKKLKTLLAAAAIAVAAPSAFAVTGGQSFSTYGNYVLNFTGDGSGVFTASFLGAGISNVLFDGVQLNFDGTTWSTADLPNYSAWNYTNNTHGLQIFGTGTFSGVLSWNDAIGPIAGAPTAVPEPTNAMMLLAGLAALGAVARRRQVK